MKNNNDTLDAEPTAPYQDDSPRKIRIKKLSDDSFIDSKMVLEESAPDILKGLQNSQGRRFPFIMGIEGYTSTSTLMLAMLKCAHFYGVTVMVYPGIMDTEELPEGLPTGITPRKVRSLRTRE